MKDKMAETNSSNMLLYTKTYMYRHTGSQHHGTFLIHVLKLAYITLSRHRSLDHVPNIIHILSSSSPLGQDAGICILKLIGLPNIVKRL